jgi:PilZ domain
LWLVTGCEPTLMEEKRKHPRTEIHEPAYVSANGSIMSCVVRNISAEGAAIDVENPAFVPARFRLIMAADSSVHECQIAWIQQKRVGISFVAAPQSPPQPKEEE